MGEYLTEEELCKWLKISPITAYRWRKAGMPFIKMGRLVRYDKGKIEAWINKKNNKK